MSEPQTEADSAAEAGPTMGAPFAGKRAAALLTLLGAGLIILAATRTWASIDTGALVPGMSNVTVSGRRALPAAIPIALAAGAGAIVLLTSGRVVRALVAAGLAIAGALLAVAAVRSTQNTMDLVAKAFSDALGVFSSNSDSVSTGGIFYDGSGPTITIWPWLTCLGAVLMVGAGLLVLIKGWSWPGPARRYERTVAARSNRPADAGPIGTWDALSRGEDPTSKVDDPT